MRMTPVSIRYVPAAPRHDRWVLVAALLLPLLVALYWGVAAAPLMPDNFLDARDRTSIRPMVDPSEWRAMSLVTPEIVGQVTVPYYQFQHMNALPSLKLDGASLNFTLPPALWVKLEHPGQAFLFIDSDAGLFARPLNEATPGFVSRCALGNYGYVSADGEEVELDTAALKINAMWVVQDAATENAQAPGWISLAPPQNEPALIAIR